MSKRMSLALGILALLILGTLIYGLIQIILFIKNIDTMPAQGEIPIATGVIVFLGAFFLLVALGLYTILFMLGIPHYFLYLKDKHKSNYLYLVKYVSIIPIGLFVLVILFTFISLVNGETTFQEWMNTIVYSMIFIIPFGLLTLLTKADYKNKKEIYHV